jgi:hypothetical protein
VVVLHLFRKMVSSLVVVVLLSMSSTRSRGGSPSEAKTGFLRRVPGVGISEPGFTLLQKEIKSYKASLKSASATVSRSSSLT